MMQGSGQLTKLLITSISMDDDAFEWDDDKAAANWRDHGVTFYQAIKTFRDPFAIGSMTAQTMAKNGSICSACALA